MRIKERYIILFIFLLGAFLRIYKLADYPHSLNRDEVALGYNAYSILETQRGEHGEGPWPMNFVSFGDYKMPGYIYLVAPIIKIFGLNNFSLRLPSAFLGSFAVVLVYFVLLKIFPKKRNLALISSLFLALAPYHIHYSRVAYETQVAFALQLLGALIIFSNKDNFWKLFSLPFFLLAMLTYNAPVFIILPLCLIIIYFFRQDFLNKKSFKSTIFFLIGLVIIYAGYFLAVSDVTSQKFEATILTKKDYIGKINANINFVNMGGVPLPLARLFFNKPLKIFYEFGKRYLSSFNPSFLFFGGDKEPFSDLSPAEIPNLYVYLLPLFIIGLYLLAKERKLKENKFIISWFLVSGITSGFVNISPNTTKLLDFHLLIIIISAIGMVKIIANFKKYSFKIYSVFGLILTFFLLHFTFSYFFIYPRRAPQLWFPGLKGVINHLKTIDYDTIFINQEGDLSLSYIYFAFYTPFDPQDFSLHAERSALGFNKVERYDKYIFSNPPSLVGIPAYEEFKEEFGNVLVLSKYEAKLEKWEDVKVFYFYGKPLWILQKK